MQKQSSMKRKHLDDSAARPSLAESGSPSTSGGWRQLSYTDEQYAIKLANVQPIWARNSRGRVVAATFTLTGLNGIIDIRIRVFLDGTRPPFYTIASLKDSRSTRKTLGISLNGALVASGEAAFSIFNGERAARLTFTLGDFRLVYTGALQFWDLTRDELITVSAVDGNDNSYTIEEFVTAAAERRIQNCH